MSQPATKKTEGIPVILTVAEDGSPGDLAPLLDMLIKRGLVELQQQSILPPTLPLPATPPAKRRKRKAKR